MVFWLLRPYNGIDGGIARVAPNHNHPVYMVGHDHPHIGRYPAGVIAACPGAIQRPPLFLGDRAERGIIKETLPLVRADGDEIPSGLAVVVATQADRAAMVAVRVVGHGMSVLSAFAVSLWIHRWFTGSATRPYEYRRDRRIGRYDQHDRGPSVGAQQPHRHSGGHRSGRSSHIGIPAAIGRGAAATSAFRREWSSGCCAPTSMPSMTSTPRPGRSANLTMRSAPRRARSDGRTMRSARRPGRSGGRTIQSARRP